LVQLAQDYAERLVSGEVPDRLTYLAQPYDVAAATALITKGAAHMRAVCADLSLPLSR
jgi:hypothetical protein